MRTNTQTNFRVCKNLPKINEFNSSRLTEVSFKKKVVGFRIKTTLHTQPIKIFKIVTSTNVFNLCGNFDIIITVNNSTKNK